MNKLPNIATMDVNQLLSLPDDQFLAVVRKPLIFQDRRARKAVQRRIRKLTGGRADLMPVPRGWG